METKKITRENYFSEIKKIGQARHPGAYIDVWGNGGGSAMTAAGYHAYRITPTGRIGKKIATSRNLLGA